jgi:uncharacterized membrane protein
MPESKKDRTHILPWRYLLFLGLCLSALPLSIFLPWYEALLVAFDTAVIAYFATLPSLFQLDMAGIRKEAERVDPERKLLLTITAAVILVIVVAIVTVLKQKTANNHWPVLLCIVTLVLAWLFTHLVYALHYAHLYFSKAEDGDRKGLDFPGEKEPVYWDFAYFSLTVGMTSQTSDVAITGRHMRKIVTAQSIGAFAYNLGVMAFMVNVVAGL